MSQVGSITYWLSLLQAGEPAAAEQLWHRFFRRLMALARLKLRGAPRGAADEEDVVLSVFDSFCRHIEQGRFPDLADREDLWRLLVLITARKAHQLVRDEARKKRGGSRPATDPRGDPGPEPALDQVLSREPSPDMAAQMAEDFGERLRRLKDDELAAIARLRLEGYTVEEIAQKLGYVERSIKRKLQQIRRIWRKEVGS
jgi:DNA-directed RNA polymerase specialized sigma24 family protein